MSLKEELESFTEKINKCEESLRKLEKLSKIITQHVETSAYIHNRK